MKMSSYKERSMHRPNIILAMCDDLGYGDTGFNGSEIIHTPHLDRLCSEGVRFTRFHAGGPVCSPTRGTCLTGRHYIRYGINNVGRGRLPAEEETLPERLRAAGYRTGHFGKWHVGSLSHDREPALETGRLVDRGSPPWERGYDHSLTTDNSVPLWNPTRAFVDGTGERPESPWPQKQSYYRDGTPWPDPIPGCDSAFIVEHTLAFIADAVARREPFFTTVWFHAPHSPVEAGPAYLARYRDRYGENAAHYYGCVTAMDEQMGRLAVGLESLGVANDTMLWFCSDNGPEGGTGRPGQFRSHGSTGGLRGRKRSLYNGGITVPAFVRWPARLAGSRDCHVPASTLDYLPTLYDYLGLELPDRPLDGLSLAPMLTGPARRRPRPIPFRYLNSQAKMFGSPTFALIGDDCKFLSNLSADGAEEQFFDPVADPYERHNLIAERRQQADVLREHLRNFLESCRHSHAGGDYPAGTTFDPQTPFQEPGCWAG